MSAAPTLPTARPEQDIPACSGAIVQTEGNGGLPKATGKLMSTPGRPLSREHARDCSPPASAQKRRAEPAMDASATKKRAVHRDSCAAADAPQRPERRALRADQIDFSQDSDSGGIRLEELLELELNAESLTPPAIGTTSPPTSKPNLWRRRYRRTSRRLRTSSSAAAQRRRPQTPRLKSILGAIYRNAPGPKSLT